MASSLVSNPVQNSERSRDSWRKRKNKRNQARKDQQQTQQNNIKWKSETQQQLYSSKLIHALKQVRISPSVLASNEVPRRGRAVREAADRVLAVAAKGRTRWSRAILTHRLKLKFRKLKRQRVVSAIGNSRSKKPRFSVLRLKGKCLPAVQRKVRILGRLVPGCRKETFPVVLEEATDYIAALEMQVRAMSALANLLSASTSGSGATGSSTPPT